MQDSKIARPYKGENLGNVNSIPHFDAFEICFHTTLYLVQQFMKFIIQYANSLDIFPAYCRTLIFIVYLYWLNTGRIFLTQLESLPEVTLIYLHFVLLLLLVRGPGSVVGIVTAYGLDGPGIKSRWGEIFRTCPDRPWGPLSLCTMDIGPLRG